jgi:hypothetical protein
MNSLKYEMKKKIVLEANFRMKDSEGMVFVKFI